VLATIPSRTLQAIAAVFDRTPKRVKFNAMDTAGKLNAVTVISAVPYRIMRQYLGRPGELGLLMGKGLADSSKAPSSPPPHTPARDPTPWSSPAHSPGSHGSAAPGPA